MMEIMEFGTFPRGKKIVGEEDFCVGFFWNIILLLENFINLLSRHGPRLAVRSSANFLKSTDLLKGESSQTVEGGGCSSCQCLCTCDIYVLLVALRIMRRQLSISSSGSFIEKHLPMA